MEPLVWAGLLLLLGMLLVLLEVFVPTAGVLGFLAVAAILSGIGLAFYNGGLTIGFGFLFGTAVVLPIVLAVAFRWFPETPIGRRLLPNLPTSDEVLPDNEERRVLRGLLGKVGQAKSQMLPSGSVVVEGRIIDAVSEGLPIDAGQNVRVIEVRGSRVVVRPLEDGEAATPARPESEDPLSRPFDSLGIEYPDDPLA
ncbi:MAG TPA: NfeD family protein [Pirellulales bacterium]|jgi:membrane-bound ClpP family serine protease|nr:NfeD family protein [Pirellulales bacterium]